MIFTSDYETISSFLLISLSIFSAIIIIFLTQISDRLKRIENDTKEKNTADCNLITEKIENNHRILSELNMRLNNTKDKK